MRFFSRLTNRQLKTPIERNRKLAFDQLEDRRMLALGDLDPTFGTGGVVQVQFAYAMAGVVQHVDGEEKTVVLADLGYQQQENQYRLLRYNENGTLDTSFGGPDGVNLGQWFDPVNELIQSSIAVQGDKVLVSGASIQIEQIVVARIQADGSLDPAFGNDGILATGIPMRGYDYQPARMAAQGDKLIVAATPFFGAWSSSTDLVVARYTSTGAVDTTFGNQGQIVVDVSGGEWEFLSGLQVDGDDVVASVDIIEIEKPQGTPIANLPSALVRIDSGGIDTQFGTNGVLSIGLPMRGVGYNTSWAMQGDKTLVPSPLYFENDPEDEFDDEMVLSLTMYDGGELDTEFGNAGVTTLPPVTRSSSGFDSPFVTVDFQPDGGIVFIQGQSIVRLLPDGQLDLSFGTNGIAPFDGPFGDFALQADGRIVLFGSRNFPEPSYENSEFLLARLLDDDDGIDNAVDTERYAISQAFSDGTTTGEITSRGDQYLTVSDAASPTDGVLISASAQGGATPATVSIEGSPSILSLDAGDEVIATHGSLILNVLAGSVEVTFVGDNGEVGSASLPAGTDVTFQPETFTFVAAESNEQPVEVLVDGTVFSIDPGETASLRTVAINILPEAINVDASGMLTVIIYGAVDFHASQIDVGSVLFAGASAWQSTLVDANHDGRLDLQLKFRRQDTILDQIYADLLLDDEDCDGILDSTRQTTQISLTGETEDDTHFAGSDAVTLFLSGRSLRELLEELFGV